MSWSTFQMLAADLYSSFDGIIKQNDGAELDKLGLQFRDNVLSLAGGRPMKDIFRTVMGRDPSPDALIQLSGLKRSWGATSIRKERLEERLKPKSSAKGRVPKTMKISTSLF